MECATVIRLELPRLCQSLFPLVVPRCHVKTPAARLIPVSFRAVTWYLTVLCATPHSVTAFHLSATCR